VNVFLNSINWLVFVMKMQSVSCEVGTDLGIFKRNLYFRGLPWVLNYNWGLFQSLYFDPAMNWTQNIPNKIHLIACIATASNFFVKKLESELVTAECSVFENLTAILSGHEISCFSWKQVSLPHSQELTNRSCPKPDESQSTPSHAIYLRSTLISSFHLHLSLLFHAFLISPICTTCPTNHTLLDLITLIMFAEKYKLWNSSLCSFLQPLLRSKYSLSTLFSDIFNLCCSFSWTWNKIHIYFTFNLFQCRVFFNVLTLEVFQVV
jgi:hypothetical protein